MENKDFEEKMEVVRDYISKQPNPRMRIGIVGSGSAGAFKHVPADVLEKEDVVLIDTDGKTQDELLQIIKNEDNLVIVEAHKREVPAPVLLELKQPPKLEIPNWSYSDFGNKHAGQPWAQMRKGKNRRFK